ncbi:MAG: metallophosphoesterase [bacterium]|nr:metallophosphoesterase [bacterium]
MRLCHFSDSHLGAGESHPRRGESGLTLRQEDIVASFLQAVDKIIALKPDLCIHSGDLFHSVRPSNKILAIAGQQLYRLAVTHKIPTVVIAGNHDSPKQAHLDAALQIFAGIENLSIAADEKCEEFLIGSARILAVPHANDASAMKDIIRDCRPDRSCRYNILVTHGVASGMEQFSMAELGEMELPIESLKAFDYTALGHYHNYTCVAERVYYAGSTDRLSMSERDAAKGVIELSLDPFTVTFHELKTRPMIDLPALDATGLRGDQVADRVAANVAATDPADKIIRQVITGLTPEILNTIPTQFFRELKQTAFSLDLRMIPAAPQSGLSQFGRTAFGRLDKEFADYLSQTGIAGPDKEALLAEASRLLAPDE